VEAAEECEKDVLLKEMVLPPTVALMSEQKQHESVADVKQFNSYIETLANTRA